jgi:type II restriction/modification system DNA methylase subunit YeeA
MKPDEKVIAKLSRFEYEEKTGKLFLVFEVTDELHKKRIRSNWLEDIEYRIVDKDLVVGD